MNEEFQQLMDEHPAPWTVGQTISSMYGGRADFYMVILDANGKPVTPRPVCHFAEPWTEDLCGFVAGYVNRVARLLIQRAAGVPEWAQA